MKTLKVNGGKSIRGIYYFKTEEGAKSWSIHNKWDTTRPENPIRFIHYGKGVAIQAGKSGNYAGPNNLTPEYWYN